MGWWRSLCGKAQFMRQLRVRAGFPPTLSLFTKPFVFRAEEPPNGTLEWKNIEQLWRNKVKFVQASQDQPREKAPA